jgi:hypothetical protein
MEAGNSGCGRSRFKHDNMPVWPAISRCLPEGCSNESHRHCDSGGKQKLATYHI